MDEENRNLNNNDAFGAENGTPVNGEEKADSDDYGDAMDFDSTSVRQDGDFSEGYYHMSGSEIPSNETDATFAAGTGATGQESYGNGDAQTSYGSSSQSDTAGTSYGGSAQNDNAQTSYGDSSQNDNAQNTQYGYYGGYYQSDTAQNGTGSGGYNYGYGAGQSAGPEPVKVSKEKKSKKGVVMPIICAVLALVCGFLGGILASKISSDSSSSDEIVTAATTTAETTTASSDDDETTTAADDTDETETTTAEATTSAITTSTSTATTSTALSASEIYAQNVDSVVYVETTIVSGMTTSTASGTGFIVTSSGYIVTNYHVVEDGTSYMVMTYDSVEYDAELIGYDESNDIAVLKIEADTELSTVTIGESSSLSVGDSLYIIGNPLGDLIYTLTTGVVSALDRLITGDDGTVINMFQTDAAVNSGNSGGPVFDENGYVVGIVTAKYSSESIEGLSFCIPIDDVISMIVEIIDQGYVSGKPSMGVSVYTSSRSYSVFGYSISSSTGVTVVAVGDGTAADTAGIEEGDIITAIDGTSVSSVSELKTAIASYAAGDTVTVTISRNNTTYNLTLTFDEYTPSDARTSYSNVYDL